MGKLRQVQLNKLCPSEDSKGRICIGLPTCSYEYQELSPCYIGFNQVVGLL